jgi:hypothetical protein
MVKEIFGLFGVPIIYRDSDFMPGKGLDGRIEEGL